MPKKSRQKFKYLKKEKSFQDEVKSIFHHFWRAVIETNKKILLEGESPTLSRSEEEFSRDYLINKVTNKFFFLQVNQQKRAGMVSTNNV